MMPLALAVALASCSYDQSTATAAIPSPLVAQVAGTWTGPVTLQQVSAPVGGALDCVGAGLQNTLSSTDTATMIVTQSGASLAATLTSRGTGLSCSYSGNAGPGNMVLNAKSCDAPIIVVRCATGQAYDVQLIGTTITASVSPDTVNGTVSNTYNVLVSGSSQGTGGVTATSSIAAVRQ
jgi:hypothetical protein